MYQFWYILHALLRLFVIAILAIFLFDIQPDNNDSCKDVTGSLYLIKWDGTKECTGDSHGNGNETKETHDDIFAGTYNKTNATADEPLTKMPSCIPEEHEIYVTPNYGFYRHDDQSCSDVEETQVFNYHVAGYERGTDISTQQGHFCADAHQSLHGASAAALAIFALGTIMMIFRHRDGFGSDFLAGSENNAVSGTIFGRGSIWKSGGLIPIIFKLSAFIGFLGVYTYAMQTFAVSPKCNLDTKDKFGDAHFGFLYWAGWLVVVVLGIDAFAEIFARGESNWHDIWARVSQKIAAPTAVVTDNRGSSSSSSETTTTTKSLYF